MTPLPVYDTADYSLPSYQSRMDDVCCLEYSIPYLPRSGFALFSLATRGKADLVHAIVSYQVLNAATPVIVAIVGFGWVIYALECRFNDEQFTTPSAGICAFRIRQYRGLDFNSLRLTLAPSPPTVAARNADFSFVAMATFGFGGASKTAQPGKLDQ